MIGTHHCRALREQKVIKVSGFAHWRESNLPLVTPWEVVNFVSDCHGDIHHLWHLHLQPGLLGLWAISRWGGHFGWVTRQCQCGRERRQRPIKHLQVPSFACFLIDLPGHTTNPKRSRLVLFLWNQTNQTNTEPRRHRHARARGLCGGEQREAQGALLHGGGERNRVEESGREVERFEVWKEEKEKFFQRAKDFWKNSPDSQTAESYKGFLLLNDRIAVSEIANRVRICCCRLSLGSKLVSFLDFRLGLRLAAAAALSPYMISFEFFFLLILWFLCLNAFGHISHFASLHP